MQRFIDETVAKARETGTVRTLLGRLRRLPDLQAKNFQVRMEAERQARNTPVQGSAADLIKKAMMDLDRALRERRLASRLILQIHDELLLEVPEAEADVAKALVEDVMESALASTCRSWSMHGWGGTGPKRTSRTSEGVRPPRIRTPPCRSRGSRSRARCQAGVH